MRRPVAALLMILPWLPAALADGGAAWKHRVVEEDYESTKTFMEVAITGRGMVIAHRSEIGEMLERTGRDLGLEGAVYGKAVVIEFCNARLSRAMMEADPQAIVLCPYKVSLYTLPDESGRTHVAWPVYAAAGPPAAADALREVDALIDSIVQEVAGF